MTTAERHLSSAHQTPPNQDRLRAGMLIVLSLLWLSIALGYPPVSRTQEARVLETSRQMLGTGFHGWMLPTLNGEPRLKKPPLAYWMTATAYMVGGVNEFVGRVPNVIVGCLTLIAVYSLVRRMEGWHAGLIAAAVLFGSYHFFHFTRHAETDAPAMLFLTVAIGSIWIASQDKRARWLHLAGAATAMVLLSKGAPAVFVLIFLVAFSAIEKRWDLLIRCFTTGAIVNFAVIAAPWFYYAHHAGSAGGVFARELRNTLSGGDHFKSPLQYVPWLLLASAPWSAVMVLAVYDAIRRWKVDPHSRFLLIWLGAILVPLCINGNKQTHYLIMLTPPMMILVARMIYAWPTRLEIWRKVMVVGMLGAAVGAMIAIPLIGRAARGGISDWDWILSAAIGVCLVAICWPAWRKRTTQNVFSDLSVAVCMLFPVVLGVWAPSLEPQNPRRVAAEISRVFGSGPYVFYGSNFSLPLCFNLRATIPTAQDAAELERLATRNTVVIAQTKNGVAPPELPRRFAHAMIIKTRDQTFELFTSTE